MRGFNARTRYALMAAMDLAQHYAGESPIKVRDIAARTGVPRKFLVHILLDLKRRALANSTRGANGGYWLMRPPDMISAAEVVAAAAGRRAGHKVGIQEVTRYERAVEHLGAEMQRRESAFLTRISLVDLLAREP